MYHYHLQQPAPQLTRYSHSPVSLQSPHNSHPLALPQNPSAANTKPLDKPSRQAPLAPNMLQQRTHSASPYLPSFMYPFLAALLIDLPPLWQPSVKANHTERKPSILPHSLVSHPCDPVPLRRSNESDQTKKTSRIPRAPTTCSINSRPTSGNWTRRRD